MKQQPIIGHEFEDKQKELAGVVNPIMIKVYQAARGGGGPTVEEAD